MMPRSRKSSSCSRRAALTLLETVAALALLASLLAGILAAKSAFVRQWSKANQRTAAVAAADKLLANWWLEPRLLPRSAEGEIAGSPSLLWRTRPISNAGIEQLGGQAVRLEIFSREPGGGSAAPLVAACTVDVVLPASTQ